MSNSLQRLIETGQIHHLVQRQLRSNYGSRLVHEMQAGKERVYTSGNLSLQHLQGAFLLLLIGSLLGVIVLFVEQCTYKNENVCWKIK